MKNKEKLEICQKYMLKNAEAYMIDLETAIDTGFPTIPNKMPISNIGIWKEQWLGKDCWMVRKYSDIAAYTVVYENFLDALLYYYGLDTYLDERLCASKQYDIKYYRIYNV